MGKFVNQHSFIVLAILLLVGVGYWIWSSGTAPPKLAMLGLLLIGLVALNIRIRVTGAQLQDQTALQKVLATKGKVTLVKLYSNY